MTPLTLPEQTDPAPVLVPPRRLTERLAGIGSTIGVILALLFLAVTVVAPAVTGGQSLTVMTGSMAPTLPPGHVIIFHPVDADTIKPGDVIAYQPANNITNGIPITHRVIGINSVDGHARDVIVQGDANPVPDAPVQPGQIIGKMSYYVPYVGLLRLAAFNTGLAWLPALISSALFGYIALIWVTELLAMRRDRKSKSD